MVFDRKYDQFKLLKNNSVSERNLAISKAGLRC